MANKRKQKQAAARKATPQTVDHDKRRRLGSMKYWVAGAAVFGCGGFWFVSDIQATMREHDLTRLGQGVPTIVQIHDPGCPRCTAHQRVARTAVSDFDETELVFLVANINTEQGRALANAHGVGHVTLLLFDGEGRRHDIIQGPSTEAHLFDAFQRHVDSLKSS